MPRTEKWRFTNITVLAKAQAQKGIRYCGTVKWAAPEKLPDLSHAKRIPVVCAELRQ
jgi:hypothetical protein